MAIHPTAVIGKRVELDPTVEVGAYAILEDDIQIGPRTRLYPHAYISTGTHIGADCVIHPFAVVGHHPQDLAWNGAPSTTEIGDGTIIREGAQIHRATGEGAKTIVGRRCYIMATAHVAHNCILGDEVKLANCALLAGHVQIGDKSFISGGCAVHQFVRVGELCIIGGGSFARRDIPPFMMYTNAGVLGPNTIGIRRAGISSEERVEIRRAYRMLYREGVPPNQSREAVIASMRTPAGRRLAEFLSVPSKRGLASSGYKSRSRFTASELEDVAEI
jgi:UDP-N-acetylglucosamine acyltransferase